MRLGVLITLLSLALPLVGCNHSDEPSSDEESVTVKTQKVEPALEVVSSFTSSDGKFSVEFPAMPVVESEPVETDVGTITMTYYIYEQDSTLAYMVATSDYPSDSLQETDRVELLQSGKDGLLETYGIPTTDSESPLAFNEHPGLSFTANNGTYFLTYRAYLVGNRLYQLMVFKDGGYSEAEPTNQFMESFKLL